MAQAAALVKKAGLRARDKHSDSSMILRHVSHPDHERTTVRSRRGEVRSSTRSAAGAELHVYAQYPLPAYGEALYQATTSRQSARDVQGDAASVIQMVGAAFCSTSPVQATTFP